MRRAVVLAVLFSGFVTAAEALTVRDVIDLTRAGLGEDVLLALIEVDHGVYAIDPATLKTLKDAGVSDKVIVALVRSGRDRASQDPPPPPVYEPVEPPPAPEPQVIVIEHRESPRVEQVLVPVPVYVAVGGAGRTRIQHRQHGDTSVVESTFIPFQSGPPVMQPQPKPQPAPVYWGNGGKLRPDAWGQPRPNERDQSRDGARDSGPKDGKK